ncbi:MAG TPA: LPS export ABC transporter periplasmic protein LptC [Cytophagales bacterium]|nr:LPS export ABC transporter periplasmic protein LptC [Cytophagales bacterium]
MAHLPNTKASFISSVIISLVGFLFSCSHTETSQPVEYNGPLSEAENVEMYYAENDIIKVKMIAKKVFEFENGDREFPDGIYLEFFNEMGKITSTLRANSAYFFSEDNQWRGRGKVEIVNIEKKEQLNTEELFWKQDTKRIFTEKFVTIKLENEVIYGTGLEAAQDLSDYTIKNPEGEFEVIE